MKRTQILVWACLMAFTGCKSADDGDNAGTSGTGAVSGSVAAGTGAVSGSVAAGTGAVSGSVAAGSGGSNAGAGGSAAGSGGSAAGTGGSTAGTGGSTAGTSGSAAGAGGSTAAGTGGSTAGTGATMASQACIEGAATAANTTPAEEMVCLSCSCAANEAAVAACNSDCWALLFCIRDNGCYGCDATADEICVTTACAAHLAGLDGVQAFQATLDMCLPECIPGC